MKKKIVSLLLAFCLLLTLLPSGLIAAWAQEPDELYLQMLDLGLVDEDGKLIEDNSFTLEDGTRLASLRELVEWLGQCGEEDLETLVYVDATGMGAQAQLVIYALSIEYGMEELAEQFRLLSSMDTLGLGDAAVSDREKAQMLSFYQTVDVNHKTDIVTVSTELRYQDKAVAAPYDVVLEIGLFSDFLPVSSTLNVAPDGDEFTLGSNCYARLTIPAGYSGTEFRLDLKKISGFFDSAENDYLQSDSQERVLWDGNGYVMLQTRAVSGMPEQSQAWYLTVASKAGEDCAPNSILDFLENGVYVAWDKWVVDSSGLGGTEYSGHYEHPPFGKDAMKKVEKTTIDGKSVYKVTTEEMAHREWGNLGIEVYCGMAMNAGVGDADDNAVIVKDLSFITKYDESALTKPPTLYYGVMDKWGETMVGMAEAKTTTAEMALSRGTYPYEDFLYVHFLGNNMEGNWGQDQYATEGTVWTSPYVTSLMEGTRQVIRFKEVELPLVPDTSGQYANPYPSIPWIYMIDTGWDSKNASIEGVGIPGKVYLKDTTAPTITEIRTTGGYYLGKNDEGHPIYTDDTVYRPGELMPITVCFSEPVRGEYTLLYQTVDANGNVVQGELKNVHCDNNPYTMETGLMRDDYSTVSDRRTFYYPVDVTDIGRLQIVGVKATDAVDTRGNELVLGGSGTVEFNAEVGNMGGMRPQDGIAGVQLKADNTTPIANPRKFTATVQLKALTSLKQAWIDWAQGGEVGNDENTKYFKDLEIAFVVDGDLSTRYPVTMNDEGQLTSELRLPNVEEETDHILELYMSSVTSNGSQGGVFMSRSVYAFKTFTQRPLLEAGADAYTISVDEWYSGMEGKVFMLDRNVPQFTAVDNGTSFTYKTDTMVYWTCSNEEVLKIRGGSAEEPVTLADAKTIQIDRVGEGVAVIQLMATNGSDDPKDHTAASAPMTVRVVDGGMPVLMFPDNGNTILALQNTDQVAYFTSNLNKHELVDGQIKAELYEGPTSSTAAEPLYTEYLSKEDKSITIPGEWLDNLSVDGEAAYTLKLSAQAVVDGNPVALATRAYLVVEPRPAKVRLQGLDETVLVCGQDIPISWTVYDFALETNAETCEFVFTVERNGESIYQVTPKKETGSYTLHLPKPEGLTDEYIVTARATNGNDSGWSSDSRTLTVYDRTALKLTANGQEIGDTLNLRNIVSGGVTTTSPVVTTYDGEVFDGLSDAKAVAELRNELSLMQTISINYKDHDWNAVADRIKWSTSTGRDGELSDEMAKVVTINYRQGNRYLPLEKFSYTSYIPEVVMLLCGLRDGSATVTATHNNLSDLTDSVDVNVELLKDQLYLFQFTPAVRTEVSYVDGKGQRQTVYSNDDGSLALFEPNGIASDVQTASISGDEDYRGTLPEAELKSGEGNGIYGELYPLNTLSLRAAAVAQFTLLRPDGEPLANTDVTLRGGVYRNAYLAQKRDDAYCANALLAKEVGQAATLNGREDQVFTTDENGVLTVHLDLEQFTSANDPEPVGVGDMLEFIFELRFAGDVYYPEIITVDSSLTKWDAQRSGENIVTLTEAGRPKPFVAVQTVSYTGREMDVRRHSGVIGPSSNYEQAMLETSVMLWGVENVDCSDTSYYLDMRAQETGVLLPGQERIQVAEASYPFSAIPLVGSSAMLTSDSFVNYDAKKKTGMELAIFSGSEMTGTIAMPFGLVDLTAIEKVEDAPSLVSLMANVAIYGSVGGANTDYGAVNKVSDGIMNGVLSFLQKLGGETGTVKAVLTPTEDPTRYQAYLWTGLNTTKLEDLEYDTNGISLEPSYYGQDTSTLIGQINDTFTLSDFQAMVDGSYFTDQDNRGGIYGAISSAVGLPVMLVLEGWMSTEIRYDFDAGQWRVLTTGGGFTAGGQLEYEKALNFSPYGIPITASVKVRGGVTVDFEAAVRYAQQLGYEWSDETATRVNDYLTALRINAYLELFGGLGVDIEGGLVAKLGPYGTLEINNENRFMTRKYLKDPDERDVTGQFLGLNGEAGLRAALGFGPIVTEITLVSLGYEVGWSFTDWDEINDYWDNASSGLGSTGWMSGDYQPTGLLYADGHNALVLASNTTRLQSRDYLDRAEQQWLGGVSTTAVNTDFYLEGLQNNSYPFAHPEVSNDGWLLTYLSDSGSSDVTEVEARYTFGRDIGFYPDEGTAFPAPEGFEGYGDSALDMDGTKDFAGAVWLREAATLDLPAGTELTEDQQKVLLGGLEVVASIWDGSQWVSTRLTNNGSQEMEPVIAVNENGQAIAAWRSVQMDKGLMDFSQNRVFCKVYDGSSWSEETYLLYNGTSGNVSNMSAAMLPDGTASIAMSLVDDNGSTDIHYIVVDTAAEDISAAAKLIRATTNSYPDQGPQLMAVGDEFALAWVSQESMDGDSWYNIGLRVYDKNGTSRRDLPTSLLERLADSDFDGKFTLVKGASSLDGLTILWVDGGYFQRNNLVQIDGSYMFSGTRGDEALFDNEILDHFSSFHRPDNGKIRTVTQITTYSNIDKDDPSTYQEVPYSYELDGVTYSGVGLVPYETTSMRLSYSFLSNDFSVEVEGVDYSSLRANSYVPLTVKITNCGEEVLDSLYLSVIRPASGMGTIESFDFNYSELHMLPGESRRFPLVVQTGDEIKDLLLYCKAFGTAKSSEVYLAYPDVGLAGLTVTKEQDGQRELLVNLYNQTDTKLQNAQHAYRVVLGVYSDPACTTPMNGKYFADGTDGQPYELLLTGDERSAIDNGTYTQRLRFDMERYMEDSGLAEIPDMGVTLFLKARVQEYKATWTDMPEPDALNNLKNVTFESLLERSGGTAVTFAVEMENSDVTSALVTLQNNSLQPVSGGCLVAALLDEEGNLLESQSLGNLQMGCEELQEKQIRFSQLGARVVIRYAETDAEAGNANAASITIDGQPLTLDSFDARGYAKLSGVLPGQYLLTVIPEAAGAVVTVNGETAENGMMNLEAGYKDVIYTITITSPDGSNSRTYRVAMRYASYTITAEAGPNGSISPEGVSVFYHGAEQTYTITADENYVIADVLVDGESVGAVESYTFESVEADHSIQATFEKVPQPPQTQTGDASQILLWSVLAAASGALLVLLLLRRRKARER